MNNTRGDGQYRGNGHAMQRRPEEIEKDIQHTQERMQSTIAAIRHDLTPGQLFDQAVHTFKEGKVREMASSTVHGVGRVVRENPLPSAVIGVGVVWLAASATRPKVTIVETTPSLEEPREGRVEHVKERVSEAKDGARERMHHARERVSEATHGARERISGAASSTKMRVQSTTQRARQRSAETFDSQPLVVGAIAIGIGALLGTLLPRTAREDQVLGPKRDEVMRKADETGARVLDKVKGKVEETADKAKARMEGAAPDEGAPREAEVVLDTPAPPKPGL